MRPRLCEKSYFFQLTLSSVLRDMLDVGKPENEGAPIQLDMTSKTLRRFLDLMYDRPRSRYREFREETEVLRALDKWGATGLCDESWRTCLTVYR